jgi:hypothetical protein
MISYRDLPPGRLRGLAYSRELEELQELQDLQDLQDLQELHLVSSRFQSLSIQPIQPTNLFRRNALVRRAAFVVSRPNIVNGIRVNYSGQVQVDVDEIDQFDYSDMPPLEEVPDTPSNSYTYEYLSELPNVIVNLVNKKLIEKSSVSMNYFNDNFCVICQENIQIVPKLKCIMRVLECTHAFHIDCVDKWFTTNKTCPTCKYTLD